MILIQIKQIKSAQNAKFIQKKYLAILGLTGLNQITIKKSTKEIKGLVILIKQFIKISIF